jgi:hypothetical protein
MIWSSGGVELVIGDCFEPHRWICEGFLSLPRGRSQLATLVVAHGLEDPHLVLDVQHLLGVWLWKAN